MDKSWYIKLFNKSVIKQHKLKKLTAYLGPTVGLSCLDVGADNGVISYLLRRRGGTWKSADLDEVSVSAIKELVGSEVYRIDGERTPFQDNEFDRVVIIDFLEHIPCDRLFVAELYRILKPCGTLVVNVPHSKNSPLRRFRLAIGQTDEKHGHLRPGYTLESLRQLLGERFNVEAASTYSKTFSELVDTLIVQAVYLLKNHNSSHSKKGAIVTGDDLKEYRSMFRVYSLLYPAVLLISKLDGLLFFTGGYMLIVRARISKR